MMVLILLLLFFAVIGGVGTLMTPRNFFTHENVVDYMMNQCGNYKDDHQRLCHHSNKYYCKIAIVRILPYDQDYRNEIISSIDRCVCTLSERILTIIFREFYTMRISAKYYSQEMLY